MAPIEEVGVATLEPEEATRFQAFADALLLLGDAPLLRRDAEAAMSEEDAESWRRLGAEADAMRRAERELDTARAGSPPVAEGNYEDAKGATLITGPSVDGEVQVFRIEADAPEQVAQETGESRDFQDFERMVEADIAAAQRDAGPLDAAYEALRDEEARCRSVQQDLET